MSAVQSCNWPKWKSWRLIEGRLVLDWHTCEPPLYGVAQKGRSTFPGLGLTFVVVGRKGGSSQELLCISNLVHVDLISEDLIPCLD